MMSPIFVVLQEQFQRPEAEGLVEDLVDEPLALVAIEQRVLRVAELLDDPADLVAQHLRVDLADPVHVEPIDEPRVDMTLEQLELLLRRGRAPWRPRAPRGGAGGGTAPGRGRAAVAEAPGPREGGSGGIADGSAAEVPPRSPNDGFVPNGTRPSPFSIFLVL